MDTLSLPYLKKARLGSTELYVSPLALGTVKLGRDQQVKYPEQFTIPNDRDTLSLLDLTKDLGINVLDTAPAYGHSEERLGQLIKNPNDWVICTKVGEEFIDGTSHFDFSAKHTRLSVERSLKRLKRDCLEIVLIHSDGNDQAIVDDGEIFDALERLKSEGKIGCYGMSSKTVEGGIASLAISDCAMVTYNLDYDAELPVLDYAQKHNKGIFIKKALSSGHALQAKGEDPVAKSFEKIYAHPATGYITVGTINPEHLVHNVRVAAEIKKGQ